jgi:exodeoxyribonuclease VII small subunit
MNNFEENLQKLEGLGDKIKQTDVSLEDALKCFEEGIKLARGMETELDKIEGKIQILMNEPQTKAGGGKTEPELDLFAGFQEQVSSMSS